jgi:hypothetical protein
VLSCFRMLNCFRMLMLLLLLVRLGHHVMARVVGQPIRERSVSGGRVSSRRWAGRSSIIRLFACCRSIIIMPFLKGVLIHSHIHIHA